MLNPPAGLDPTRLRAALADGWGVEPAGIEYRPVGWGSHHWAVTAADGASTKVLTFSTE